MSISLNGDGIVSGVTTFTTPLTGVTTFSSVDATSVVVGSAVTINSSGINAGIVTATSLNSTGDVNVGTGVTIYASSGIVSATTFYGDASGLTNVPAGSSVTGNFTITNGNIVVSSGYGIDFSATANSSGTMSSELFDDYEEGTWTPHIGGNATFNIQWGSYIKVGRHVTCWGGLRPTFIGTGNPTQIHGLPYAPYSIVSSTATGGGSIVWADGAATASYNTPSLFIGFQVSIAYIGLKTSSTGNLQDIAPFWSANNQRANFHIVYETSA